MKVLNGPSSDDHLSLKLNLRFHAGTGSGFQRCLDDMMRFVDEVGEP